MPPPASQNVVLCCMLLSSSLLLVCWWCWLLLFVVLSVLLVLLVVVCCWLLFVVLSVLLVLLVVVCCCVVVFCFVVGCCLHATTLDAGWSDGSTERAKQRRACGICAARGPMPSNYILSKAEQKQECYRMRDVANAYLCVVPLLLCGTSSHAPKHVYINIEKIT